MVYRILLHIPLERGAIGFILMFVILRQKIVLRPVVLLFVLVLRCPSFMNTVIENLHIQVSLLVTTHSLRQSSQQKTTM